MEPTEIWEKRGGSRRAGRLAKAGKVSQEERKVVVSGGGF